MILLSFQPRAIMKLFYERAAVPIIQIIPFSCSAGKQGEHLLCAQGRGTARRAQGAVPGARHWKWHQSRNCCHRAPQNLFRTVVPCEPLALTQNFLYKYLLVYSNYLGIRNS